VVADRPDSSVVALIHLPIDVVFMSQIGDHTISPLRVSTSNRGWILRQVGDFRQQNLEL